MLEICIVALELQISIICFNWYLYSNLERVVLVKARCITKLTSEFFFHVSAVMCLVSIYFNYTIFKHTTRKVLNTLNRQSCQ